MLALWKEKKEKVSFPYVLLLMIASILNAFRRICICDHGSNSYIRTICLLICLPQRAGPFNFSRTSESRSKSKVNFMPGSGLALLDEGILLSIRDVSAGFRFYLDLH